MVPAIAPVARGAPAPPTLPRAAELSPQTRRRLADAAKDSVIAPWQRDFMIRLTHGGRADSAGGGGVDSTLAPAVDALPADGRWTVDPPPAPRYLHAAVYDPVRDRMVVFGGYAQNYDLVNDVWVLSLTGNPAWTKLEPHGTPPSGRHQHTAIYDPVRDRVVVFGGYQRWGALNDTWALSLSGTPTWTQLAPAGSLPTPRFAHSAIYDSEHDRMIVFGGYGSARLNDVWALIFSDSLAWTQLSPGGTPPAARYAQSAIYDSVQDRMVVCGGFAGGFLGDVWALSLSDSVAWSELTPAGTAPEPREYHAAVYDPVSERMVVFGGLGSSYLGDAWALSLTGPPQWSPLTTAGPQPGGRSGPSGLYDPVRRRMVVYGGTLDGFALVGEVWALSLDAPSAWANLTPGVPPPGLRQHRAIYDPVRDRMVVFGGYDGNSPVNNLWAYSLADNSGWTLLRTNGTAPPPRLGHTAIYDPVRDRLVVFGGLSARFDDLNDVWALSLSDDLTWTQLHPSGTLPEGRESGTAIYDASHDRMIVFGGITCCIYLNDTWALSLSGNSAWTLLVPNVVPPPARYGHSAIYDPVRPRMLVFGGANGGTAFSDVWALPLVGPPAWTRLTPAGPPPPVVYHTAIYDPIGDRMVAFGQFAPGPNQTWGLSLGGNPAWGLLATAGTSPTRSLHSAIYDPVRDRMVVFGGVAPSATANALHDVWNLTWGRDIPLTVPGSPGEARPGQVVAYPNPSRGDVTISFTVPRAGEITLRVFDMAGRVVRTLVSESLPAGSHSAHWDRRVASGAVAPPGLYFCEVRADDHRATRRLVLIR